MPGERCDARPRRARGSTLTGCPRSTSYFLRALVTNPGAHTYAQDDLRVDFRSRIARLEGAEESLARIDKVYAGSDVDSRHLELSLEEIDERRAKVGWHAIVNEVLLSLARRTLARLFATGVSSKECDALVVVASNWDGFPGISRRMVEELGFRSDAVFYDVANLGCGGANHGLALAHMLLESGRKSVCVLCIDALATHIQTRRYKAVPNVSDIVARVLPSDGGAALVLSREPGPRTVFEYTALEWKVHAWPDSGDYMVATTDEDEEAFGHISKEIRTRILPESSTLLTAAVLAEPLFVHPGGTALVRRLAESAPGLAATAKLSSSILREHGNMSAPTVLFVLARALEEGFAIEPRARLVAFGPGVYSSLLSFESARRC